MRAILFAMAFSHLVPNGAEAGTVHEFTWDRHSKTGVEYYVDGKRVEETDEFSMERALSLKRGDTLKVIYPDDDDICSPLYSSPLTGSSLIPECYLRGIRVEFYCKGVKTDTHLFWWSLTDNFEIDEGGAARADFYLDGELLGCGEAGLSKLTDRKWGHYPSIFIIQWLGNSSPYRSSTSPDANLFKDGKMLLLHNREITAAIIKYKIRYNERGVGEATDSRIARLKRTNEYAPTDTSGK